MTEIGHTLLDRWLMDGISQQFVLSKKWMKLRSWAQQICMMWSKYCLQWKRLAVYTVMWKLFPTFLFHLAPDSTPMWIYVCCVCVVFTCHSGAIWKHTWVLKSFTLTLIRQTATAFEHTPRPPSSMLDSPVQKGNEVEMSEVISWYHSIFSCFVSVLVLWHFEHKCQRKMSGDILSI